MKTCVYDSFDAISPRGDNFIPVKTGEVSSPRGKFVFSFLVVNTVRGLTTHRVEFNPGQNFSCKQALVESLTAKSTNYMKDVYG